MPKRPAGKQARKKATYPQSVEVAPQTQDQTPPGDLSDQDSQPPVSTNPPPTPDDVDVGRPAEHAGPNVHNPAPQPYDETVDDPPGEVDWTHRKEIYVLPNGSTIIARNEIESGAYQNKGAKLVDVIQDE